MSDDPAVTRIPSYSCPHCGKVCDAVGTSDGAVGTPTPGDISGCIYCGLAMVFTVHPLTGTLQLRPMTVEEFEALPDDNKQDLARVAWYAQYVYQPEERARRN